MRSANNFEVPVGLDDDDEEDEMELTNAGREVKKIVKKRDNTGLYDSDDGEDDDYTNVRISFHSPTLPLSDKISSSLFIHANFTPRVVRRRYPIPSLP